MPSGTLSPFTPSLRAVPVPISPLKREEWRAQRSSVPRRAVLTKKARPFTTRERLKTPCLSVFWFPVQKLSEPLMTWTALPLPKKGPSGTAFRLVVRTENAAGTGASVHWVRTIPAKTCQTVFKRPPVSLRARNQVACRGSQRSAGLHRPECLRRSRRLRLPVLHRAALLPRCAQGCP